MGGRGHPSVRRVRAAPLRGFGLRRWRRGPAPAPDGRAGAPALGNRARGRRAALGGRHRRRLRRRLAHCARMAHRGRRIFRAGEVPGQRGHAGLRRLGARVPQALRVERLHRCGAAARSETRGRAAAAARRVRFRHPAAAGEGFPRARRSRMQARTKNLEADPGFVPVRAPRARRGGELGARAPGRGPQADRRGGAGPRAAPPRSRARLRARDESRPRVAGSGARAGANAAALQRVARRAARRLSAGRRRAGHPRIRVRRESRSKK